MAENSPTTKKSFTPDWLVRGVLTKIGETFDRLTGRNWKPSSSLATSELIERLKRLLDSEAEDLGAKGKFVPHNIKLKMQWDKFSTDSEAALKTLETELLTAAVDHLNDNLYHTYAPLKLEVKPDYFTEGVKLLVSFDKFAEEEREAELRVTLPDMNVVDLIPQETPKPSEEKYIAKFTLEQFPREVNLKFNDKRRLSVGRTRENDLTIDDASISKIHASLVLNSENQLLVADTGSTNGTFIGDERIAYGKAFPIETNTKVKFGTVEVSFEYMPQPTEEMSAEDFAAADLPESSSVEINGFEFLSKTETISGSEFENEKAEQKKSAESIILKPIAKPENLSESFNPKRASEYDFDEKNDSPK